MFELLDRAALRVAADDEVRAAVEAASRAEAMSAAAKFDAISELTRRLVGDDRDEDTGLWLIDGWESAAAEVGAALGVSGRRASAQMHLARDLASRLPKVAALLRAGVISERIAAVMAWRTKLVDEHLWEVIDAELSAVPERWGALSDSALKDAVDAVLAEYDPDAVREYHDTVRGMDVQFGKPDDATGTASVFGRVYATTRALFENAVAQLLAGVCKDDPRTMGQRREAAWAVIAARGQRLACTCGATDCPNSDPDLPYRGTVSVHVVADADAVAQARALLAARRRRVAGLTNTDAPEDRDEDFEPVLPARPSVVLGGGLIPTPLLAELIGGGARVTPLVPPCSDEKSQRRYRPSVRLDRFVRLRDMRCRFPGCNVPADRCDVDHAIPHPNGLTHPGNLRCLCRKHHLLRTFWLGWTDRQLADGTIEWTSPNGGRHVTKPGAALLFPDWDTTTPLPPGGDRDTAVKGQPSPHRGMKMPKRRRTRAKDEAQQIKTERQHKHQANVEYDAAQEQRWTRTRDPGP